MSYEVMDESLAQLTEENYGCEIMKCLQPTGRVQPHSIAQIPFLFSPLEAKTYAVEVRYSPIFRDYLKFAIVLIRRLFCPGLSGLTK